METTIPVPGREGRLPRQAVRTLVAHQITASVITVAAVAVAVGLATVISPDTWLWPAATGGSLRHWIVGIGLGLVGWCLAMDTLEDLDRHVTLATTGHTPTAGHSPARTMLLTGFAAVLTWPVWDQIAHAWQVNDLATAEPVGIELAVRLIPLVVLLLVPAAARAWISEYAEHLWAQHDEHETRENTEHDPAPLSPVQD